MDSNKTNTALTGPPLKKISSLGTPDSTPLSKTTTRDSLSGIADISSNGISDDPTTSKPSAGQSVNSNSNNTSSAASTDNSSVKKIVQAHSSQLLDDSKLKDAILSDSGPSALLQCAKKSINSAKELATFVKKSAVLESEHLTQVKKLTRNTRDLIKRPDGRGGTYGRQLEDIIATNEQVADVSNVYVAALTKMHDELMELAKQTERVRKSVKETSTRQEKFVTDAETVCEKTKAKYESLCEEYDRMRTGDPTKNKFGFKQSRTPQHEEELHKKVVSVDAEYQQRVSQAQKARKDLIEKQRPSTGKQLKDLIQECDSAVVYQLQKYANLNETLVLNRGFIVSPLKDELTGKSNASLREKVSKIDNELDLYSFVMNSTKNQPRNKSYVEYKKHPVLAGNTQSTKTAQTSSSFSSSTVKPATTQSTTSFVSPTAMKSNVAAPASPQPQSKPASTPTSTTTKNITESPNATNISPVSTNNTGLTTVTTGSSGNNGYPPGTTTGKQELPVFGTPLDVLLDYEEGTVPRIVYQCVQAVDNFGLEIEGIYRASGNGAQIQEIKRLFDTDSAQVDLLHPSNTLNDIHSVASALKLFFRELPDPLLTSEQHQNFLLAARIENDIQRRDMIHATVNNLPDANYTTLRYLAFHLYRVQEREAVNRMSTSNLSIVWGPTLMATDYANVSEMALQGKVVETIISNAYVIFDVE